MSPYLDAILKIEPQSLFAIYWPGLIVIVFILIDFSPHRHSRAHRRHIDYYSGFPYVDLCALSVYVVILKPFPDRHNLSRNLGIGHIEITIAVTQSFVKETQRFAKNPSWSFVHSS